MYAVIEKAKHGWHAHIISRPEVSGSDADKLFEITTEQRHLWRPTLEGTKRAAARRMQKIRRAERVALEREELTVFLEEVD